MRWIKKVMVNIVLFLVEKSHRKNIVCLIVCHHNKTQKELITWTMWKRVYSHEEKEEKNKKKEFIVISLKIFNWIVINRWIMLTSLSSPIDDAMASLLSFLSALQLYSKPITQSNLSFWISILLKSARQIVDLKLLL